MFIVSCIIRLWLILLIVHQACDAPVLQQGSQLLLTAGLQRHDRDAPADWAVPQNKSCGEVGERSLEGPTPEPVHVPAPHGKN